MEYCVYLTIYRGNKLPPFYIGYSTVKKIKKGYRGSACSLAYGTIWRTEQQTNPHLFKTKIISLHSTQQEAKSKEYSLQSSLKVHTNPLYINKNINGEKFFILYEGKNNPMYGRKHSPETRKKISDHHKGSGKLKGKNAPMYGKTHTEKTKALIGQHTKERMTPEMRNNLRKKQSDGIYITPWGEFESSKMAARHPDSPISDPSTIIRRCKFNQICSQKLHKTLTPEQLGYRFIPKSLTGLSDSHV